MRMYCLAMAPVAVIIGANIPVAHARVAEAEVARTSVNEITVQWSSEHPIDVYLVTSATADIRAASLVRAANEDGQMTLSVPPDIRPYILLHDSHDDTITRVAERVLSLDQGSNFRDIGGYPAADGKHVRWGMIYRSGANPMLTPQDQEKVRMLDLHGIIDLRSSEERALAPVKIQGVPYAAVGYSLAALFPALVTGEGPPSDINTFYRDLPDVLAPQMRLLFSQLLRQDVPIEINCSAGQDRTGFATAMILYALGVSRDVILKDYLLSTQYRQPEFELPPINAAAYPNDPIVAMLTRSKSDAAGRTPQPKPLQDTNGTPYLVNSFEAIENKWGSIEAYLDQALGIGPIQLSMLRTYYLE